MTGQRLGPRAVVAQQAGQASGQRDDPGMLTSRDGVVQAGQQARALGW
jgi:hypothetical protein